MSEWHISEELLGRFIRLEASRPEPQQVVRHLLSGCAQCLELAGRTASETGLSTPLDSGRKAGGEEAYEAVFRRALGFATEMEQKLVLEKLRGWAQWARLEPLAPELRLVLVESNPRFHNFGLYEQLLEASRWYRQKRPADALDIIQLALVVAERLDSALLGEELISDLKARAWAALGNAQRILEDFEEARLAFQEAWSLLESGTGDPVERASLIDLESSYMKDVGQFEKAESSLREALGIYRRVGSLHEEGRILLKMGEAIGYVDPERGIAHLRKAVALIDGGREPLLELCAQHALARFLCDLDQPEEALAVLERASPLFDQFPNDTIQLRFHWLEGKISYRLGEYLESELIFRYLLEELGSRNLNQEVVLVAIDLAQVLAARGEAARAAELAAECCFILKSWGLRKDALVAWLILQNALSPMRSFQA